MSKAEFNKEMGHYLRDRGYYKRTNPFLAAKRFLLGLLPKEKKEELPLDIPPEQVDAVISASTVKTTVKRRAEKPVRKVAPAKQPKKEKVGIMKWFGSKDEEEYEVVQTQPAVDEDVKEVLKITFKWLKRLDQETVEEFKSSSDFEKYKAVLDKYGLIKK